LLAITTKNLRKDLKNADFIFDFSNYPTDHPLFSLEKQNLLGYFRDESKGAIILEFIGVRSKVYSVLSCEEKDLEFLFTHPDYMTAKKICKGIRRNVIKNDISHSHYRECISDITSISASMHILRSNEHSISLQNVNKIAFTSFDCKRFLLQCGIHSVPFGHYIVRDNTNILCPFCEC
jgi:hypothetical protein